MKEIDVEKKKLQQTIDIVADVLNEEQINLDNLYNDFDGSREELWHYADMMKIHITNLERSVNEPYFARIDFKSDETGKVSSIYIGKTGVNKNNKIIVTDWRAPISSLYYDSELGNTSYNAPEGEISGDLKLKRQYEIEDGKLQNYYDVDLVSNDDLFQKYLNTNNDARLHADMAKRFIEENLHIFLCHKLSMDWHKLIMKWA